MNKATPTAEIHVLGEGKRGKLSEEAYAQLKQRIFDFRLPPGQRYSEAALAEMLAISRTPLRLALHILEHEGYLQNVGGHNCWQVRALDLSYYEDLYDFRSELEALAIRLASKAGSPPRLDALAALWCADKAERRLDSDFVADSDEAFHLAIVGLANNTSMARTFAEITDRIRIIRRVDFVSERRIEETYDEHGEIIRALLAGRFEAAEDLVRRHIDKSREEIRKITVYNMSMKR
ncbi:GntR family transcriptional regulator [Methylobacterium organophilum]|uniref:HTH-type transcriptional repressor GlaR n=1 Tax=Methylobacterium organophilum TaxID=410 RepID=A0ABQ4T8G7_METOR|nr:GntR family transcriptional regulator [Methylobacterium organophilum]UMY17120.1 GntR family transcriptional regulator [Methylobacterium organophilum]GJE26869.1 HTH-type transcriptional repressor GlaR [Methylobacterium organophilum]